MFPSLCAVLSVPFHSLNLLLCLLWCPFSWPCHTLCWVFFLALLIYSLFCSFFCFFSFSPPQGLLEIKITILSLKNYFPLFWRTLWPIDHLSVGPTADPQNFTGQMADNTSAEHVCPLSLWMYKPQTTKLWGASCEFVGKTLLLMFNPGKEMQGSFWAGHWKKKWERNVSLSASILDICCLWEEIDVTGLRLCT